jgi:heme-degrading monooxygenase HmoA
VDHPPAAPPRANNFVGFHAFKVRNTSGAAFESQYAKKKFHMKMRRGFQYMSILRKLPGSTIEEDPFTYIVTTSWQDQVYHDAWYATGKKGAQFIRKQAQVRGILDESGGADQTAYYATNYYPEKAPEKRFDLMHAGFGSYPNGINNPLKPDMFVSIRWFASSDKKTLEAREKDAKELTKADGLRFVQILQAPAGFERGARRIGFLSSWESKDAYEASAAKGFDKPDLGEGLYAGVLSSENPKNFDGAPKDWTPPF